MVAVHKKVGNQYFWEVTKTPMSKASPGPHIRVSFFELLLALLRGDVYFCLKLTYTILIRMNI